MICKIRRKLFAFFLITFLSMGYLMAQDTIQASNLNMDTLDFSNARLSLAGPNAFYLRDVDMGDVSIAMVFRREDDGIWRISEIFSDTNTTIPSNIVLDFARLETVDQETIKVNGILIDGRPLSGTFTVNNDSTVTAPSAFASGSFIGTSLERANLDAGLFTADDLDPLRTEIDRLKTELATINENYTELEKDLTEAKSNSSSIRSALDSAQLSLSAESAARVSAEVERDNLAFEKAALEVQITELESLETSLNAMITDLEKDRDQLKTDLSSAQSDNDSLTLQNTTLQTSLAASQANEEGLQAQLTSLQSNFSSLQTRNASLETEIAQLQTELSDLQTNSSNSDSTTETVDSDTQSEWKAEAERLQGQVSELQSKITQLEQDLSEVQTENDNLKTDLSTANGQISELESDLNSANSQITELQSDLSAANSSLSTAQSEIESLRSNLADSNAALATAQAEAEQARNTLQTYLSQSETGSGTGELDGDTGSAGSFTSEQIQNLQSQVAQLQVENESLIVQRNELESEIRETLLSSGLIGLVAKQLDSDLTPGLELSDTRIGQWQLDGSTAIQSDPAQYFAKLDLPVAQGNQPMLYRFNAQSTGSNWVGMGIHIYSSDVILDGYGYGKSLLLWFTRDPDVYRNNRTYLELYVSEDDINMQRVLNAMIPDDIADGLDIELLYQPDDQYINVAVNGVERVRYKTWFDFDEGIGVALRSLNSGIFSNLEILTKED
jgi:DNA repair exonuclease SbcCD ATPase subunit